MYIYQTGVGLDCLRSTSSTEGSVLYDQMNDTEPESESSRGEEKPDVPEKHQSSDIENETGSAWPESERLTTSETIKDESKLELNHVEKQSVLAEAENEIDSAEKLGHPNGLHAINDKEINADTADESYSAPVDNKDTSAIHDEEKLTLHETENQQAAQHEEDDASIVQEAHLLPESRNDSSNRKRDEKVDGAERDVAGSASSSDQPKVAADEANGQYDAEDDCKRVGASDSIGTADNHAKSDDEKLKVASTTSDAR